jgi:hypothetical protein
MQNVETQSVESKVVLLQQQVKYQRFAIVALAVFWLITMPWMVMRAPRFPAVLSAERLEIREPDGKPALVLANSQRPIASTMDGQAIMAGQEEERRGTPSIIFFDGKGDEVGGMLFGVRQTSDGYSAMRHLSLDGYKQDQTVVLSHYQDPRGSTSGLTISDRPDGSFLDSFRQIGLQPGASREQLTKAIQAIPQDQRASRTRELFGTTRAFFGSKRSGEARLELRDGQGRLRIVLDAPEAGDPSIQILDDTGRVALRLPK